MDGIVLFIPALMQTVNTEIALTGMNVLSLILATMAYLLVGSYFENELLSDGIFVVALLACALFGMVSHMAWMVGVVLLALDQFGSQLISKKEH
jgi:hypothetical protein